MPHLIRLNDCDAAGVAFFARIIAIAHEAYEDALAAAGLPLPTVLKEGVFGLPIVHVDASFRAPLRHGDAVIASCRCVETGTSKAIIRVMLSVADHLRAEVNLTVVAVARADGRPIPLPESARAALTALR